MTPASTTVHRALISRLILPRPRARWWERVGESFICGLLSIRNSRSGNVSRTLFHARDRPHCEPGRHRCQRFEDISILDLANAHAGDRGNFLKLSESVCRSCGERYFYILCFPITRFRLDLTPATVWVGWSPFFTASR